ncbi:MAG: HNH endonuclease signature motif containing protein [Solirubrobacterales bacterium]
MPIFGTLRGMASPEVPKAILDRIPLVTNKRARRLLELMVEHGEVTTEQLTSEYGYNHPPRAKKDATDLGFPIVSRTVKSKDGTRNISAYRLDPAAAMSEGRNGRQAVSKALRDQLLRRAGGRCAQCGGTFADRSLQVDHLIPYEIAGESTNPTLDEFQMLCGSCNRSKSWTCETDCPNWTARDASVCETCMWASVDDYAHIATRQRRQATLTWDDGQVVQYDELHKEAEAAGMELHAYLRELLRRE